MSAITLRAHFDGEQVDLDDQVELKAGTKLMITVLPKETEAERAEKIEAATKAVFERRQTAYEEMAKGAE
ncbi:hypothetical protein BH18ACI2_BH18ACI2_10840 [soil metagenome]